MSVRWNPGLAAIAVGLLLAASVSTTARAEEATGGTPAAAPMTSAPAPTFTSTKNIGDTLKEARQRTEGRFDLGIRDWRLALEKKIYEKTGIRFAAIYTLIYQRASDGDGPRDAAGGDFDLIGTWDAIRRGDKATGALEAAFEGRHRLGTELAPAGLSTTIDSLWTTVSGFNVQDFSLTQIYWRQDLFRDRLHYRIGKISPYATFFGNRYNSSSLYFMNYAFADNPAVFMPGNGLGIHATWDFSKRWSISAGMQNANGIKTSIDPTTLEDGEFWYALQVQLRTCIRGLGVGTYRLGGWFVDARERADASAGTGGVLSVDQELSSKTIAFVRFEYQRKDLLTADVEIQALTATKTTLRGGLAFSGPIKAWPDDLMGVALAWGRPTDQRARDSYVGEIFYRSQFETALQLTLSVQAIRSSTIYEEVFVLGVRLRLEF